MFTFDWATIIIKIVPFLDRYIILVHIYCTMHFRAALLMFAEGTKGFDFERGVERGNEKGVEKLDWIKRIECSMEIIDLWKFWLISFIGFRLISCFVIWIVGVIWRARWKSLFASTFNFNVGDMFIVMEGDWCFVASFFLFLNYFWLKLNVANIQAYFSILLVIL